MDAYLSQNQKMEQGLALTPQLRKSLEILQSSALDLNEIVARELESNPLLEEAQRKDGVVVPLIVGGKERSASASEADLAREPAETKDSAEDSSAHKGNDASSAADDGFFTHDISSDEANKRRDFFFDSITQEESFQEYLMNQARADAPTPAVAKAFAFITGYLDDRGFLLEQSVPEAEEHGYAKEDVLVAIELMRNMDPPGIGAFNMRESLMLQLARKSAADSLAYKILDKHYELLLKRRVSEIAQKTGVSERDVEGAIAAIGSLNTSPARGFEADENAYITIDLIAKQLEDGSWRAMPTDEYVPKLRINNDYRTMLSKGGLDKSAESYIKEKTREGKFIIEAIEHRQSTLKRIGDIICARQREFFEGGPSKLKPMTMQDVADEIELHPTTISRAVAEKYMQTPYGVLPLKKFFATGIDSADGESELSNETAKVEISKIIASEPSSKPFSDGQIAEMLREKNISVARRTVAKYREDMGIPPKTLRKRF